MKRNTSQHHKSQPTIDHSFFAAIDNGDRLSNMQNSTTGNDIDTAGSCSINSHSHRLHRPNSELTQDEKRHKQELKRLLKRQSRRRKLEVRLAQTLFRKEHELAEKARANLDAFLSEDNQNQPEGLDTVGAASASLKSKDEQNVSSHQLQVARDLVESIYHKLAAHLQDDDNDSAKDALPGHVVQVQRPAQVKELQTEQARKLLKHFTKGSQTVSMFENEAALRGYTRHKFFERAMVVVTALTKLHVNVGNHEGHVPENQHEDQLQGNASHVDDVQVELRQKIKAKLLSVRSIASVGCGPGCDAVGVAAWLSSINQYPASLLSGSATMPVPPEPTVTARPILDYAVLLDWAMPQWERIVGPLKNVMVPGMVGEMVTSSCDVRSSLTESNNAMALELLSRKREEANGADNDSNSQRLKVDLVVTSYLLSETRGQWHAFFDDLVQLTDPGTLFIFTDPTAWQLHVFAKRSSHCMDFCWLDSSMDRPELQALEGRVGPGVLAGIKRGQ
jgi:hypothetical protein